MAETRIKGQETSLIFVVGGEPINELAEVRSFDITGILEIITEGYLGETSDRRDEIFRGTRGSMEIHVSSRKSVELMLQIIDRAARRDPDLVINAKTTLQFPTGDRLRILVPNIFFGEIPLGFASRGDYGTTSFSWESGSKPRLI